MKTRRQSRILELIKVGEIEVSQEHTFDDIYITSIE